MEPAYLSWFDQPLRDAHGKVFGLVQDVLVGADDAPLWVEAQSSATRRTVLVPADAVRVDGSGLHVPFAEQTLQQAPPLATGDGPTDQEAVQLRRHYAAAAHQRASAAPDVPPTAEAAPVARGTATEGPSVLRAEEELHVGTEVTTAGTVRLRKWVETDTVSEQIVLHQERARVEREPVDITNVDAVLAHAEIGEVEYEVVLRDEQVVATKVTVPREVVRLSKDVVQEIVLVEADLRHEEVEVETTSAEKSLAGRS